MQLVSVVGWGVREAPFVRTKVAVLGQLCETGFVKHAA
jgi:hypothetical protein